MVQERGVWGARGGVLLIKLGGGIRQLDEILQYGSFMEEGGEGKRW